MVNARSQLRKASTRASKPSRSVSGRSAGSGRRTELGANRTPSKIKVQCSSPDAIIKPAFRGHFPETGAWIERRCAPARGAYERLRDKVFHRNTPVAAAAPPPPPEAADEWHAMLGAMKHAEPTYDVEMEVFRDRSKAEVDEDVGVAAGGVVDDVGGGTRMARPQLPKKIQMKMVPIQLCQTQRATSHLKPKQAMRPSLLR